MRKAIYTVITGGYDTVLPAPRYKGWDTILFCDEDVNPNGWELYKIGRTDNPFVESRRFKILSHRYLSKYDLVCYVDGNQILNQEPPDYPVWFEHGRRKNIYEEAKQLIINGRYTAEQINSHIEYVNGLGYQDCGLYLNGYFVRDHSDEINELHEVWFRETAKHSHRDQLTLPLAIWMTGIKPKGITPERVKYQFAHVTKAH